MHSVHSTITSCCANASSDETTSLENDATNPFDTSHDATHERVLAYTTSQDIGDDHRGEYKYPNATWTSQSFESCDSIDRVDDPGREASLALTKQALQQHNTKNMAADGKNMKKYPFDEHHMEPFFPGGTAAYAPDLDEHAYLKEHVEPYSYPRQCSRHHHSIVLAKVDNQNLDADIGLPFHPVEYQEVHPYPTCINEVDLYDHLPESEFFNDPSNIKPSTFSSGSKEVSFQVLDPWSNAYAGIGTQFSS
ncbi:hypothetical protein DL98DRAFT_655285 [Cadophora sp. DSE1049]|nr:hypothetical protein DL98DRAFT_655285 [Cadophora sp. DSE1049]